MFKGHHVVIVFNILERVFNGRCFLLLQFVAKGNVINESMCLCVSVCVYGARTRIHKTKKNHIVNFTLCVCVFVQRMDAYLKPNPRKIQREHPLGFDVLSDDLVRFILEYIPVSILAVLECLSRSINQLLQGHTISLANLTGVSGAETALSM